LAGAATTVSPACGDDTPAGPDGPEDEVGSIGTNHGHRAVLTVAQLEAGAEVLLDIQGQSTHGHFLTLSADDVRRIRAGERVSRFSTDGFDDKHDHVVTFN
jgi:hypothetical protein